MNSILSDLYNGKIFPADQYSLKSNEYQKIQQEHYRQYQEFIDKLRKMDPPLDKPFIQFMDEQLDMLPFEFSEIFANGFRLGARMMLETFQRDLGTEYE